MGSCVSISEEDPSSARFRLAMGPKAGEVLAPAPATGGVQSGNGLPAVSLDFKSMPEEVGLRFRSPRCGTKDETFFESRECFESDCEDDFFSVNGGSKDEISIDTWECFGSDCEGDFFSVNGHQITVC